ncbi:MAG: hypothetical protein OXN89_10190 [Bryobacterales bacterium]|nr:hypothetical protein [Bryobacterales bacterium]
MKWDIIASCAVEAASADPEPRVLLHAVSANRPAANAQDHFVPVE